MREVGRSRAVGHYRYASYNAVVILQDPRPCRRRFNWRLIGAIATRKLKRLFDLERECFYSPGWRCFVSMGRFSIRYAYDGCRRL